MGLAVDRRNACRGDLSESLVLAIRPGPHVIEKVVVRHLPAPGPSTSFGPDAAVANLDSAEPLHDDRSPEPPSLAASWLAKPDYQRAQELVLRLGLDALPGRSPMLSHVDSRLDRTETAVPSAGDLRRLELEKLLNPGPGGPS